MPPEPEASAGASLSPTWRESDALGSRTPPAYARDETRPFLGCFGCISGVNHAVKRGTGLVRSEKGCSLISSGAENGQEDGGSPFACAHANRARNEKDPFGASPRSAERVLPS